MNYLFLWPKEYAEGSEVEISDAKRVSHLNEVLKASVGDELRLCLINKGFYTGELGEITKEKAKVIVKSFLHKNQGCLEDAKISLNLAFARPQTVKKVLEHGSAMGIGEFNFFKAALSEKSYSQSSVYQKENAENYMALGLAQSGRYFNLPKFNVKTYFPNTLDSKRDNIILSLNQSAPTLKEYRLNKKVALWIGPERGWTQEEQERIKDLGAHPIRVSDSILRVENALISVLSQLELLCF